MYRIGIDVSLYQQKVDWDKVRNLNIAFGFIRALNGVWEDVLFRSHWVLSKGKLLRGAYLYYKDAQDPKGQARKLFELLASMGDFGELPPALDIEDIGNPSLTASKIKLCLEELERLFGRKPIIYTRATVWNPRIGKVNWAGQYPLWVAHYTLAGWQDNHIQRTLTQTQPALPYPWSTFAVWQITDKQPGAQFGIVGTQTVDTNAATDDTLDRLSGGQVPVHPPTPALEPGTARVLVHGLRMRSRPRTNESNISASLNKGEIVQVLRTYQVDDEIIWHMVMRTDHRVGWAAEWHPELVDPVTKQQIRGLEVVQ